MSTGNGGRVNQAGKTILVLLVIFLLTALVYIPGLSGGYIFDDFGNLVENHALASPALHKHFWVAIWSSGSSLLHRPLSMFSFAAQMWFTGMDPWPLKLVNVLIHLFNGLLVFLLSLRVLEWLHQRQSRGWLLSPRSIALLMTGAWVLAPIQLTAVLYVVQRMEALSATFVMLGLLAWWHGRIRLIEGRPHAWWWIWGGLLGGTLLATLAKETGILLPAYAFLVDWLVLGFAGWNFRTGRPDRRLLAQFALILFLPAALGLAWLLPGILSGHAYASRSFDFAQRLWTEGRVMIDYLHWIVAPNPHALSLYHDDIRLSTGWLQPWTTLASWLLITALIALAVAVRRRAPLFALGVLWFFAGQALVSTILPLELVYEHRNYLPDWGVFLGLFGTLSAWRPAEVERRRVMRLAVVAGSLALVALYAGLTAMRAQVWGNPFRLAYFEATIHPNSPRAMYDLGRLMMTGNEGSPLYQLGKQTLLKTSALPNADIQPLQGLIFMAAKHRQPIDPEWWQQMRNKIVSQPLSAEDIAALYSLVQCGIQDVCQYRDTDMLQLKRTLALARQRYPHRADVITLGANFAANITHDYNTAYRLMLRTVSLAPNKFQYWKNLMVLQMAAGRLDDAAHVLDRMRELNPLGTRDAQIADLARQLSTKKAAAARSVSRETAHE